MLMAAARPRTADPRHLVGAVKLVRPKQKLVNGAVTLDSARTAVLFTFRHLAADQ